MHILTPLTVVFVVLVALASLSACNTMEGMGKDIEAAGEKIQEEAD